MSSACSAPSVTDPGSRPSPGRSAMRDLVGHAHLVRRAAGEAVRDPERSRAEQDPTPAPPPPAAPSRWPRRGLRRRWEPRQRLARPPSPPRGRRTWSRPSGRQLIRPPRARRSTGASSASSTAAVPRSFRSLMVPPSAGRNRSRKAVASEDSVKLLSPGMGSSPGISAVTTTCAASWSRDAAASSLCPALPRPSCSTSSARAWPVSAVPSSAAAVRAPSCAAVCTTFCAWYQSPNWSTPEDEQHQRRAPRRRARPRRFRVRAS